MRSRLLLQVASAGIGAILLATACGGGGDDVNEPPVTVTTGKIAGRVVDTDSANGGVSNITVQVSNGTVNQTVTTVSTGAFTVSNLEPGTYTVSLTPPAGRLFATGEAGTRSVNVVASNTAATVADFQLARTKGSLAGSVKSGSAGLAGVTLGLTRAGFSPRSLTSDNAGNFTLAGLPTGNWKLSLSVPGNQQLVTGETGIRVVTITDGQTTQVPAFMLAERAVQPAVEIHINGSTFSPANVTVSPGTLVRWINDGGTHTITPENSSQPGVFPRTTFGGTQGTVLEHTFGTPGQTYRYRCEIHSTDFNSGMVGSVTVQ